MVEVEVYRGRAGLAELEERWRGLVDELTGRRIIHAYDWHRSFFEAQEPDPDSSIFVVVSVDGAPQAILPLRPEHRSLVGLGRRPGLEVPLNPHVPFTDIIARDPAALRAVARQVLQRLDHEAGLRWDYISIRRTLTGSHAARSLADAPGCSSHLVETGRVDYLMLDSYETLFAGLSSHFRNNLRRARKRAEAMGEVTYHTATQATDCAALFEEFLQVEASGWKGTEGTGSAIALDQGLSSFYRRLMERFAVDQRCRIDVMRHGSRPIAAAFQLVMDGTIYGLKIGFDESYSAIAPGNLLHWHIFRTACADPRMRVYNMASDTAWHAQWHPLAAELYDITICRPGLTGRLAQVEQRVVCDARVWRRRAARHWFVTRRGHHRLVLPSRRHD